MNPASDPTLVYVYAVTPPAPVPDGLLTHLSGVSGSPVTLLAPAGEGRAPVAFVISDVAYADWAEEVLEQHFEDLQWLEETARAHHLVIETLAAHTTVLPLRMATLYQDRVRALRALEQQGRNFAVQLDGLRAHTEYGVKIYVRPAAGPEPAAAPAPTSPGKAYLQARRAHHDAREEHYRQAQLAADRIADIARGHASLHVRHAPQSGPLAARADGENVLNDAFLVPDGEADTFRAAVHAVVEGFEGIRLEVTGPWAPYSFAATPVTPPPPGAPAP
ncbi:GvpL/GvpF family gas vesicle protein [Streptomyces sp. NPDC059072]|uniref:GvpL/GvpF family gas vesicle protein n=1 Tax=Streptomyces sp. NPDC059072 TaxID=3346715 RepID=UPI003685789F